MSGKEELKKQLAIMDEMVDSNVCSIPDPVLLSIAEALRGITGRQYKTELSKEKVALYFSVSTRTIDRWIENKGFPKGHRDGHHELSFSLDEVIEWKHNNIDLFT